MHVILRALLLRPGPGGRIRVAEDHAVKARHGACINGKNMVADMQLLQLGSIRQEARRDGDHTLAVQRFRNRQRIGAALIADQAQAGYSTVRLPQRNRLIG